MKRRRTEFRGLLRARSESVTSDFSFCRRRTLSSSPTISPLFCLLPCVSLRTPIFPLFLSLFFTHSHHRTSLTEQVFFFCFAMNERKVWALYGFRAGSGRLRQFVALSLSVSLSLSRIARRHRFHQSRHVTINITFLDVCSLRCVLCRELKSGLVRDERCLMDRGRRPSQCSSGVENLLPQRPRRRCASAPSATHTPCVVAVHSPRTTSSG